MRWLEDEAIQSEEEKGRTSTGHATQKTGCEGRGCGTCSCKGIDTKRTNGNRAEEKGRKTGK